MRKRLFMAVRDGHTKLRRANMLAERCTVALGHFTATGAPQHPRAGASDEAAALAMREEAVRSLEEVDLSMRPVIAGWTL